jgi:hypothetical protein
VVERGDDEHRQQGQTEDQAREKMAAIQSPDSEDHNTDYCRTGGRTVQEPAHRVVHSAQSKAIHSLKVIGAPAFRMVDQPEGRRSTLQSLRFVRSISEEARFELLVDKLGPRIRRSLAGRPPVSPDSQTELRIVREPMPISPAGSQSMAIKPALVR